jgi:wyosine [tRNA(Phe)-imidazoG37] synthetase (radical SAM superfamily)
MSTFLFDKVFFGPVQSRRLGVSLGINLLPLDKKYCNFNCIYCECGWNYKDKISPSEFPSRIMVHEALKNQLIAMNASGKSPDVITFAGNGEPTLHPEFPEIVDDAIELRKQFSPAARIAVLTNSTMVSKRRVADALKKIDQNILKLDSVNPGTFDVLNCPAQGIDLDTLMMNLIHFPGQKIIQTMFLRGELDGRTIDNTTAAEIDGLIDAYNKIKPEFVMIYTFERATAANGLHKIPLIELMEIAERIERAGIVVEVSG